MGKVPRDRQLMLLAYGASRKPVMFSSVQSSHGCPGEFAIKETNAGNVSHPPGVPSPIRGGAAAVPGERAVVSCCRAAHWGCSCLVVPIAEPMGAFWGAAGIRS